LANAWRSGASSWTTARRERFANIPPDILAIDDGLIRLGDLKQPVVRGLDDPVELRVLCVLLEPTLQGEWHALAGPKLTSYVDATSEGGKGL
jgi:hypothetical protein